MKVLGGDLMRRQIAACLVFVVAAQFSYGAGTSPQSGMPQQTTAPKEVAENTMALPSAPEPQQPVNSPSQPQPAQQQDQQDQQNQGQKPVGTAVGPVTRPSGIAGSRPAGAAIAPAKQRRVRRILISVGIIAGAAIAVGAVAGLSHASSSHP